MKKALLRLPIVGPLSSLLGLPFSYAWLVWSCGALFYCFQFMLRVSPGVMSYDLMENFAVDACGLGILTACYYYTYATLQIPMGAIIDRISPRHMVTGALLICSVGNIIFSSSPDIIMAGFGRGLIGVGAAAAFLSCVKLATLWFPPQRLPMLVGLTIFLGTMGAISAGTPMGWMVEAFGWKESLWYLSFVGFFIALLAWLVIRDSAPQETSSPSHPHVKTTFSAIIKNPQTWIFALYGGLMYVPLSGFGDMWAAPFMMTYYGVDKAQAGSVVSLFYLGIGIGAPAFSYLCTRFNTFKPLLLWPPLLAGLIFLTIFHVEYGSLMVTNVLLFICGLALGCQFLVFAMVCLINSTEASATASGFHNMVCMLSGVIAQPFIGYLLRLFSGGGLTYSASDYQQALLFLPLSLFAASGLVILMKNIRPE